MLYGMPERRAEPFEAWHKDNVCPICGQPNPCELYFQSENKHIHARSDIVGCDKCISTVWDEWEINDILEGD